MQRNITTVQTRTGPSTTAQASWYSQPVPTSQNPVATMTKNNHVQRFGRGDNQQRIGFPRSPYPSLPRSEPVRCHDQNSIYHSSRTQGINDCSTIPDLAPSTMKVQELFYGERGIIDNNTTSSPSSTSTAITLVNGTSHTHLNPSISHAHQPIPARPQFSIRQTFSAYPNIDLFDKSLESNRNCYSMRNLAQEVKDITPDTGRMGVRLQDPAALLRSRLLERRRKKRNPLTFSKTALLHVYDLENGKDMPTRQEGTKFHDYGDANCGGPWPRNREAKWDSGLDRFFLDQADKAREKMWRYNSVKKVDVWILLEEGKDLSGREERMREKAMAKREEGLREQAEARKEEGLKEQAEAGDN